MAVDPYAPCPCGSGKKLKFCCGDLAGEIEKIEKLVASDQPRAALAHVDQLLAKDPERASLLDIKAMIELSTEDYPAAAKTIVAYLSAHPQSPAAHAQAALLAASLKRPDAAVDKLQNAIELTDRDMTERVYEAIGAVGHSLLVAGDVVAARAHLLFFAGVAPANDNRAVELLLRLNLQGGLPLLLRDQIRLAVAPDGIPSKAQFDEATRLSERGLWRRASAEWQKLVERHPEEPAILFNDAIVRGWLGDRASFVAGLRKFAGLANTPFDDAVEAEALAQLVDQNVDEPKLESVRLVYPLLNEDAAAERLAGDRRAERYELDPFAEGDDEENVTRPRATFLLLDREAATSADGLTIDNAPNVLAFISLYGKRTDRDARIEVTTDRDRRYAQVEELIPAILGDAIGSLGETEVVAEKPASEEALSWRWRLPDETPPALRRQMLSERRRQAILDDWTAAPRGALGGLSPQDAAGKPELRIPLLASVLIVEQAASDPRERELFQDLRDKLGLERAPAIDPAGLDFDRLPLVHIPRLDMSQVGDDALMRLFNRATMAGAGVAMIALAEEIVRRSSIKQGVDVVYRQLVRGEPDPDRALEWVRQAKSRAADLGGSPAQWGILEMEVQIERGDPHGLQAALDDLRKNHMNEPGVAEAVYQLLYSTGLISPQALDPAAVAERRGGMAAHAPSAPAPASKLWTPDQEAGPVSGATKSAIWTP